VSSIPKVVRKGVRHFAAFDRREARLVGRSRLTSASSNTCAVNRAGSGNRLRAANRRGRNIDQAAPVASARATRASSGRG
jgi:hypothetical protein